MVKHRYPSGLLAMERVTNTAQPKKIIGLLAAMKKQGTDYLTIKSTTPQIEVWNIHGGTGDSFRIMVGRGKNRRIIVSGSITKIMPTIEKQLRKRRNV